MLPHDQFDEQDDTGMSKDAAFVDLGFARVDVDRRRRTGFPEVIFGQGKTPEQVTQIARVILEREPVLLATRISREQFAAVQTEFSSAIFHERARCLTIEREPLPKLKLPVGVVAAGTSDLPVAEEAAVTLEIFGNKVERIFDAGVAGLHRLLIETDRLRECAAVVVVAGMEGAPAERRGRAGRQAGHRRADKHRLRRELRRAGRSPRDAEQLRERGHRGQHRQRIWRRLRRRHHQSSHRLMQPADGPRYLLRCQHREVRSDFFVSQESRSFCIGPGF